MLKIKFVGNFRRNLYVVFGMDEDWWNTFTGGAKLPKYNFVFIHAVLVQ